MIGFRNLNIYQTTAITIAVVCLLVVFFIIYFPIGLIGDKQVVVSEGQGLSSIAETLKSNNAIRSKYFFVLYVLAANEDKNLKAGKYTFSGRKNIPEIVSILVNGLAESDDVKVTIPEGFNIWEIDQALFSAGLTKLGDFSSKFYNEEGFVFPDTYRFKNPAKNKLTLNDINISMRNNFQTKTGKIKDGLSEEGFRKIIIIASILEKEAKTEEDMRLIAGIINRRLANKMPLQIDATVAYGACLKKLQTPSSKPQASHCDVSLIGVSQEIKIDSEFNTYIRPGLPVGPISNPGHNAIEAALKPQLSDYLYYLSTRDGSQIIYAKTPAEHATNRRKYLGIY